MTGNCHEIAGQRASDCRRDSSTRKERKGSYLAGRRTDGSEIGRKLASPLSALGAANSWPIQADGSNIFNEQVGLTRA